MSSRKALNGRSRAQGARGIARKSSPPIVVTGGDDFVIQVAVRHTGHLKGLFLDHVVRPRSAADVRASTVYGHIRRRFFLQKRRALRAPAMDESPVVATSPAGTSAVGECRVSGWQEVVTGAQLAAAHSSGSWVVIPAELFVREQIHSPQERDEEMTNSTISTRSAGTTWDSYSRAAGTTWDGYSRAAGTTWD
ncbi:hypothetical protein GCM10022226_70920 [Sphaerisporangium flaviroseum]|uniref:Uncharacterized protein n=1 Tax=Sphaerisporangium flaviroseum TaxID=509199 RepID=A0ABP7JAH7_9ACTN